MSRVNLLFLIFIIFGCLFGGLIGVTFFDVPLECPNHFKPINDDMCVNLIGDIEYQEESLDTLVFNSMSAGAIIFTIICGAIVLSLDVED